jgi:hypothetical protein
LGAPG